MMKLILTHTKSFRTQAELMKNKQEIIDEIQKMSKKYDKIINEIKQEKDEDYEV